MFSKQYQPSLHKALLWHLSGALGCLDSVQPALSSPSPSVPSGMLNHTLTAAVQQAQSLHRELRAEKSFQLPLVEPALLQPRKHPADKGEAAALEGVLVVTVPGLETDPLRAEWSPCTAGGCTQAALPRALIHLQALAQACLISWTAPGMLPVGCRHCQSGPPVPGRLSPAISSIFPKLNNKQAAVSAFPYAVAPY